MIIRKHLNESSKLEPVDDTVNGGYIYLLYFRCNYCRNFNIQQFKGAGIYNCKTCNKEIYVRRER